MLVDSAQQGGGVTYLKAKSAAARRAGAGQ